MGHRFVTPEPVRLPLSGGDYIDIKKRLNHGDEEDMHARWSPFVTPGTPAQLNRREVRNAKVLTYLLGWSLTDATGAPVPYSPNLPESERLSALNNLDPDSFTEIHEAIVQHEERLRVEREALKKTPTGSPAADATSPSPSAVAGPLPPSVN